jgi:hypothetical protein
MNSLDAPPTELAIRERLEGMSAMRGVLFGAAISVPVWAIVGGALAALHALATMR